MKKFLTSAALMLVATTATADIVRYDTEQSFDDVIFGLENAILDEGLVVDHISHTGEMLARTKEDVGGTVDLFIHADVYSFCSARISREVMEADPMNVSFCPYQIFVIVQPDTPDTTTIGFRSYPEGAMQKVEALLDGIARASIGLE
ncbi:DUF302 domain-containing protein [Sagittula sp. NFXS13]|uniref:Uncharacterized protein (DUF302 family) n=1 Tax=Sagittula marina TaxID=943940 RepID=A0A7W6GTL5_9RHOB|nr:DUF302 domain-containing protein [Sagittula marina]MBB3987661.1 uncharacterized protein (DUF302 family) [Sagittula marina]